MYNKNLFIIPSSGSKIRWLIPEIIKAEKERGKIVYWLTDTDNIEYGELQEEAIETLKVEDWGSYPFLEGNIYQILCSLLPHREETLALIYKMVEKENAVILIDEAAFTIGYKINEILYKRFPADIYLFFDDISQIYSCISEGNGDAIEYKEKKFLDRCKKEYHTYEKNRIFWMENRGVAKVRRNKGDSPNVSKTRPLPTYQPYEIFGCTLYPCKQGSMPGMTIEDMVKAVQEDIANSYTL